MTIVLAIITLIDQPALVEPLFAEDLAAKVAADAAASARVPQVARVLVAAKWAGVLQTGNLRGGTLGAVEVGYRLPVLRRSLGVMAELGLGGLWGDAQSLAFNSGLLAMWLQPLGDSFLRLAAGPTLDWFRVRLSTPQTVRDDSYATLGATAGAAFLPSLPRGALLIEARYRLSTVVIANTAQYAHGATLAIGYAHFFL